MWLVFDEFKKGIYFFLTPKGKNYVIVSRRAYSFFSFVKGGVRARGGKGGGGLPQIFEPPIFGGVQEKIWAKPVFEDVFIFYYYYFFYV